jgi:hypothetical protein
MAVALRPFETIRAGVRRLGNHRSLYLPLAGWVRDGREFRARGLNFRTQCCVRLRLTHGRMPSGFGPRAIGFYGLSKRSLDRTQGVVVGCKAAMLVDEID